MFFGTFRSIRLRYLICTASCALAAVGSISATEPRSSIARVAWNESRLVGFPDAPAPFKTSAIYPAIRLNNPLGVSSLPGTRDLLVHVHRGGYGGPASLMRFNQDDLRPTLEEFLTIDEIIYGVAFHPNFHNNGWMYVGCNGNSDALKQKCTKVLRFTVDSSEDYRCDLDSRVTVIEWPSNGHNGGDLVFGKDGMLYVSAGDGTSDSDANLAGQDLSTLPGSMLRINVDVTESDQQYSVPKDNPFINLANARPEIWAYGLRNPWRISLDTRTGDLWAGINGQDLWETAQVVRRGENYGWSITEGSHDFQPGRARGPTPIVLPTIEHPHSEARSLTGGHVYYGQKHKRLWGHYLYGDYATGMIWAAKYNDGKVDSHFVVARTSLQITGFGIGHDNELIIVDYGGGLHELVPNDQRASKEFPRLLSETGIYSSTERHQVHPGLIPYEVNSPLWSDGAMKERFIGLPGTQSIDFNATKSWDFPDGTVLVKTFSLPLAGRAGGEKSPPFFTRIETRLMTRQQGEWFGYSYRWNEEQTDAVLVESEGLDECFTVVNATGTQSNREQTWHYPSRSECMVCHSRASNFVLGLSAEQTNKQIMRGSEAIEQLEWFRTMGLFRASANTEGDNEHVALAFQFPKSLNDLPRLADPASDRESLENRVRSYLHSNCANCHVKEGGGNSKIILAASRSLEKTGLVGVIPMHDKFGLAEARLITPGDPQNSVLLERLKRRGKGQMPPLASNVIDHAAVRLVEAWIRSLPESLGDEAVESLNHP